MKEDTTFASLDGSGLTIGIAVSRWNGTVTDALLHACKKGLLESGVSESAIHVLSVPGSYEVVYGAKRLIEDATVDAVIAIGCLIKGETLHFEYIAEAVSHGIMQLSLEKNIPIIFGILACLTEAQAMERSTGSKNHGALWGKTAIEMALLRHKS